jgi:Helix-turn-helix domain
MTPDYSSWLTKQQAADAIGVSTKTIEQLAKDRKIEQAVWRPENRGMPRAVYEPSDVARMAQERRGEASAFVLPAGGPARSNGNGHHPGQALTIGSPALPSSEDVLRLVFAMAHRALTSPSSESSQSSERSAEPLFLTVDQAAAHLNWTPRDLRRAIRGGEVPCRHKERRDWRTWRIRRKDLEQL